MCVCICVCVCAFVRACVRVCVCEYFELLIYYLNKFVVVRSDDMIKANCYRGRY